MLVEFYAREIVAQQQQERAMAVPRSIHPSSASPHSEGMYMRSARDKRREDPGLGQTPTPP
jgi:hypothetical protein